MRIHVTETLMNTSSPAHTQNKHINKTMYKYTLYTYAYAYVLYIYKYIAGNSLHYLITSIKVVLSLSVCVCMRMCVCSHICLHGVLKLMLIPSLIDFCLISKTGTLRNLLVSAS